MEPGKVARAASLFVALPLAISAAQSTVPPETTAGRHEQGDQSNQDAGVWAVQPGIGIVLSAGFNGQLGNSSSAIKNSIGYGGNLRYGTSFGVFLGAGIHVSTHDIEQASPRYRLTSFFLEPKFVALRLSSHWAPFVSARIAYVQEGVDQPGAELKASGRSLGGGLGAAYRLTPQVALEVAFSFGVAALGDYVFTGEFNWYDCIQELEPGTPLPETVVRCEGSTRPPGYACYPPFYDEFGSNCSPPEIPYDSSDRSTTWFQVRLGIHLSTASP
ncbi:MAG: hypothetical protein P8X82_07870 [Gemmatimonadales bacterium]|jgi:hypothetical protein